MAAQTGKTASYFYYYGSEYCYPGLFCCEVVPFRKSAD